MKMIFCDFENFPKNEFRHFDVFGELPIGRMLFFVKITAKTNSFNLVRARALSIVGAILAAVRRAGRVAPSVAIDMRAAGVGSALICKQTKQLICKTTT